MDGYQAAKAIRALPDAYYQQVPILALTADTQQEVTKHAEASLFTDVIVKPFNPEELQQKIARYVVSHRAFEESSSDHITERLPTEERCSGVIKNRITFSDWQR